MIDEKLVSVCRLLSINRYIKKIVDIFQVTNDIFLNRKGDFIIFPCNNSMVTFTVKEYKRSVIDEFS
ncbi:hypothetical protein CN947_27410 [Bacillus cereus]|nr:hypothetical protein CN947_27410 [Bacillus cereus]